MDRDVALTKIAEALDAEGEITVDMKLDEFDSWDSLTKLSVMIMLDEDFAKHIDVNEVKSFVTVQDIINVIES